MKDIFLCLLINLSHHGKIFEASMFESGDFANVAIKTKDGIYRVSVMKDEKVNENE